MNASKYGKTFVSLKDAAKGNIPLVQFLETAAEIGRWLSTNLKYGIDYEWSTALMTVICRGQEHPYPEGIWFEREEDATALKLRFAELNR